MAIGHMRTQLLSPRSLTHLSASFHPIDSFANRKVFLLCLGKLAKRRVCSRSDNAPLRVCVLCDDSCRPSLSDYAHADWHSKWIWHHTYSQPMTLLKPSANLFLSRSSVIVFAQYLARTPSPLSIPTRVQVSIHLWQQASTMRTNEWTTVIIFVAFCLSLLSDLHTFHMFLPIQYRYLTLSSLSVGSLN